MAALNLQFVAAVGTTARQKADGWISVESGGERRTFHVRRGELIAAESTARSDRLGDLLARRGKLDPALIDPVSEEAKRQGRLLGEQLVHDGLITHTELAQLLEEQVSSRFEVALHMAGVVKVGPREVIHQVVRKPLGAVLVAAFRGQIAVEDLGHFLSDLPERFTQFPEEDGVAALQLQPWEARVLRRLSDGEKVAAVIGSGPSPERAQRLIAALTALAFVR